MRNLSCLSRLVAIALLKDKISAFEGVPQIYGTQYFYSTKQKRRVFYPIESPDDINQLSINMGLDPLENYALMNDLLVETKYNEEFNR